MISVTILVKNGEPHLKKVLDSLSIFEEVIVFDTGSTDKTEDIAKSFSNVKFFEGPFEGFGPTHNHISSLCSSDWILSIDADEVISEEFKKNVPFCSLDPKKVYAFPYYNFYKNTHIKWCGWHPEKRLRLYNRKYTSFSDSLVHEKLLHKDMKVITLPYPVYHYTYSSLSEFLLKMERYSTLFAEQNVGKRYSSPLVALKHCFWTFFKSYFLRWGFLGGYEGLLVSSYMAHTAFYKYLKLYEMNLALKERSEPCQI
jgi:glycosyltransferase involved in cell wall biosynthesis